MQVYIFIYIQNVETIKLYNIENHIFKLYEKITVLI